MRYIRNALYRQIKCTEDAILLQSDINSFMEWASIWLMKPYVDKCHSMSVTLRPGQINSQFIVTARMGF